MVIYLKEYFKTYVYEVAADYFRFPVGPYNTNYLATYYFDNILF